ncbi:helix-turn-helix domain-containing protein [Pararobbsia alpina]|uniref:helix-turn-helix domain-containing protein n=1 Tax=Pararobbsia alpina TaxID=621374 RepID=UPI0039A487A1
MTSATASRIVSVEDTPQGIRSVYDTLKTAHARLERFAWLGDELAIAIWQRDGGPEMTSYLEPGHHTLSCYLDGGYRTERETMPGIYGAPSRLCALPGEHESRWWVPAPMRFMHIYFLPGHFTRRAVVELDREPRELTLADRTYFEDPQMAALCLDLAQRDWEDADARLYANETVHELLNRLLHTQSARAPSNPRGGLSPSARRTLRDYIDAHLDSAITLGELARVANLSEFHLARMFTLSFGMSPHAWITERRVDRARHLLRTTDLPLDQIASQCGYADPSHLSHRFRGVLNVSPGRYRKVLGPDNPAR